MSVDIPESFFINGKLLDNIGKIFQIDECLLRVAQKNNKEHHQLASLITAFIQRQDEQDTNRNSGWRIGGLWVVGLCCVLQNGFTDARFL